MNFRRLRWLGINVIILALIGGLGLSTVHGQGTGLDLVLLIDSSGSTAETDPGALRIQAAEFLLDYVQSVGEAQGITHRFAAANFSAQLTDEIPWTWLQGDAGRGQLTARSSGATDFGPALEYALQLRRDSDATQPMPIILFTDGAPCPTTPCPTGAALTTYFQGLESTVAALEESGAQIFVVAIGEDAASADTYWRDLLAAGHYERVTAMEDLSGLYRRWLSGLLGLTEDERGTRFLDADDTTEIRVEPYLEQIVISAFKNTQATQIEVLDAAGDPVPPTRVGGTIYVRNAPRAGTWRVRVTGGGAQVWIDRRYATLTLDAPTAPQALGAPVEVIGQLIQNGIVARDDSDLLLNVEAIASNGTRTQVALPYKSDGRYTGALTGLTVEGVYTLTLSAEHSGQSAGARQTTPVTVSLFPVPVLTECEYQGDLLVERPLTITAGIDNTPRIGLETSLFARLLRADGSTVATLSLQDDGLGPDRRAGDGIFTAQYTPAMAERYSFQCVIQGESRDGVALDAASAVTRVDVRATAQELTATPTPRVTSTPTATHTVTPTPPGKEGFDVPDLGRRYPWLIMGLVVGGLMVAGYLVRRYETQLKDLTAKLVQALADSVNHQERADKAEADAMSIGRNLAEETARADTEKKHADEQMERAEKAEQERDSYRAQIVAREEIERLIEEQKAETDLGEKLKISRLVTDLIVRNQEDNDKIAFDQSRESFEDSLFQIRGKIRTLQESIDDLAAKHSKSDKYKEKVEERQRLEEEYQHFVLAQASSPEYPIVRALAENIAANPDKSRRSTKETIKELYQVLGSTGSNNARLLRAMTEIKNAPIASLCELIYTSLTDPEPQYDRLCEGIERHLGESGRGLYTTYQLIGTLTHYPLKEVSTEIWQYAVQTTEKTGPQSLYDVLRNLQKYFYIKPGERTKEWYREHANQFVLGKHHLQLLCSEKGLPELTLLLQVMNRWHNYAETLAESEDKPSSRNIALKVHPSLDLRTIERLENPYFYEERLEKGLWLLKVPIVIYNNDRIAVPKIQIKMTIAKGNPEFEPKDFPVFDLAPYTTTTQTLQIRAAQYSTLEIRSEVAQKTEHIHIAHLASRPSSLKDSSTLTFGGKETAENIIGRLPQFANAHSKPRAIFLQGMPGTGRTIILNYIHDSFKMKENIIPVHLNLNELWEKSKPAEFRQQVWRDLLTQIQEKTQSTPIPPGDIDGPQLPELIKGMLDSKQLLVTIDGVDYLPESEHKWLSLEFITDSIGGVVIAALDQTNQTTVEQFWKSSFTREPIKLLDHTETKELVERKVARSLTDLAHRTVWIYSGGHPGFINCLCEKLSSTDAKLPAGMDDIKKAAEIVLSHDDVKRWYNCFSQQERCLLDVLSREGFVQESTGLFLQVRREETDSNAIWTDTEKLQKILQRKYPLQHIKWDLEMYKLLTGLLDRQIIEVFEPQKERGTLRWRMGWVYVKAKQVSV